MQWFAHNPFDDNVLRWLNALWVQKPDLGFFLAWLSNASLVKMGPFGAAVCYLRFRNGPERGRRRALVAEAVLVALCALALGRLLSLGLPYRPRPYARPELLLEIPSWFEPGLRTWSSFPSDHAVTTFAFAFALWRLSRPIGALLLLHATVIVSLPRTFLALHHPTDQIAGALFGALLVLVMSRLAWVQRVVQAVLALERKRPGGFYTLAFLLLFELVEMFNSLRTAAGYLFNALRQMLG